VGLESDREHLSIFVPAAASRKRSQPVQAGDGREATESSFRHTMALASDMSTSRAKEQSFPENSLLTTPRP